MRASDLEFQINSGEHKGKRYGFTLLAKNGEKQWAITPRYEPPPSIIKEEIMMVLMAQEKNIPRSGALELKAVNKILDQLRNIASATSVTLRGFDQQERLVLVDENGFSIVCLNDEKTKEPEYTVNLTCWGLYGQPGTD